MPFFDEVFGGDVFGPTPFGAGLESGSNQWQYATAIADISSGLWHPLSLFTGVSGLATKNSPYVSSSSNPLADTFEVKLDTLANPNTGDNHILNFTYEKAAPEINANLTVSIFASGRLIATRLISGLQYGVTENSFALTTGEAALLSGDYRNLSVRFTADTF